MELWHCGYFPATERSPRPGGLQPFSLRCTLWSHSHVDCSIQECNSFPSSRNAQTVIPPQVKCVGRPGPDLASLKLPCTLQWEITRLPSSFWNTSASVNLKSSSLDKTGNTTLFASAREIKPDPLVPMENPSATNQSTAFGFRAVNTLAHKSSTSFTEFIATPPRVFPIEVSPPFPSI